MSPDPIPTGGLKEAALRNYNIPLPIVGNGLLHFCNTASSRPTAGMGYGFTKGVKKHPQDAIGTDLGPPGVKIGALGI